MYKHKIRQLLLNSVKFIIILVLFLGCKEKNVAERTEVENNDSVKVDSLVNPSVETKTENTDSLHYDSKNNFDKIKVADISVEGIKLDNSLKDLIKKMGKPDSITNHINEFDGSKFFLYHYRSSNFSINAKDNVDGFEIKDYAFVFDYGKIKAGDTDQKLLELFPLSYKNKYKIDSGALIVKVQIDNRPDYILFSTENGKIISFMLWQNW